MSTPAKTPFKKIAIVGAGGHIGHAITTSLLTNPSFTLTALTRPDSTTPLPSGIHHTTHVSYTDLPALTTALRDHDFLIISLSATAPASVHQTLIAAASAAGIRLVMPNAWGTNIFDAKLREDGIWAAGAYERCLEVERSGMKYVALCCGFWLEWSLALGEAFLGIDIAKKEATFYDDGETKISLSTWRQCGEAVKGLLELGQEEVERRFGNNGVYVAGWRVSQREMLDAVKRVEGEGKGEWVVRYEGAKERYERGLKELEGGDQMGFARALYARGFFKNSGGDMEEDGRVLDNEVLGVQKEELDEAVRRTVKMVERGWTRADVLDYAAY